MSKVYIFLLAIFSINNFLFSQDFFIEPNINTIWALEQQNVEISWHNVTFGGNVEIHLYRFGSSVATISASTANDGSFNTWDVPTSLVPDANYVVRIHHLTAGWTNYSDFFRIDPPAPQPPTVETRSANNIASTEAYLRAYANANGATTLVWFEWGPTTSYGNQTWHEEINGSTTQNISHWIGSLTPGQTYHFRVVATNSAGPSYGDDMQFTTLTSPGNLTVAVKNIDGTGSPLPGANGIVRLYNSSGGQVGDDQVTNSSGVATFSNLAAGTGYYVKAYHNPTTIFGQEYWGQTSGITITAGQTTNTTHNRNMPYDFEVRVFNNSTNADVTEQSVPLGTILRYEIKVRNPSTVSYSVRCSLAVDINKISPFDYNFMSSSQTVAGNNGTTTLVLSQTFTPTQTGDYYAAMGTQTYVNSAWGFTNSGPWGNTKLFNVSGDLIQSLYGNVINHWDISLFGNEYKVFAFRKDGSTIDEDEIIYLPFETNNSIPTPENFITDTELARVLLQKYELKYRTLIYTNLTSLREGLFEMTRFYDLGRWWYSDNNYLPAMKRKVDRVMIGKVSFSIANEIVKAKLTGGASVLGLIGSVIEPFANSGELQGIDPNEIQGLILAQSVYNGEKTFFQNQPSLIRNYQSFEKMSFILDNIDYAKDIVTLKTLQNAAQLAAKQGDLTTLLVKRNALKIEVQSIAGGFLYDGVVTLLSNLSGLDNLSKQIDVYSWLNDAHFDAIYAVSNDCINLIDSILSYESGPYSVSGSSILTSKYHDLLAKNSLIIKSLETELVALQLRRLSDINNRFLPGVTWWLGATQSNINEVKSDYENYFLPEFNDHREIFTNYLSNTLINFESYVGALEALKNQFSNNNLMVKLIQENSPLVLDQFVPVQLKLSNNYLSSITIQSLTFSDLSGTLIYQHNFQPLTLQPDNNQTISVNIKVPRNYYWLYFSNSALSNQTKTFIQADWTVNSVQLNRKFIVPHVITSFAKIDSLFPTKGIYRPGENINITMKCSGTLGLSNCTYGQMLLEPNGTNNAVQMATLPSNGIAVFQKQASNGPFGAYGFYGFVMQGGDVIIPQTYANKILYLVPELDGNINQFDWSNCILIYPSADSIAANTIKNIVNIADNKMYRVENYTLSQLRTLAQSSESILIGGNVANPLVNDLGQFSLTQEGDAILNYFTNAFANKDAIVVAGWNLRDTEIAVMGLMDEYKNINLTNQVSGIISYDNSVLTGLSDVNVNLMQNGNIISSSASGSTGDYLFNNIVNGSYSINSSTSKPWGGVNSTDALQIRRHIAGISLLSGLRLFAADVNVSSTITSTDALLIRRRVAGLDPTFASGDWLFENPAFNVSGQNVIQNFKGLCFGDVNGTYVPSMMMSKESLVNSSGNSEIYLKNNEVLSVPIKTLSPLNVSALTLVIKYPSETIEIESISSKLEGLLYHIQDDEIRIAWDDLSSVNFKPDEAIITLSVKNKNQTLKEGEISFTLEASSELADVQANVIKDVQLDIPRIKINYPEEFTLLDCYPNPFNPSTMIEYKLPENSVVRLEIVNIIGERVGLLIEGTQEAGTHRLQWDASELPSGVYVYRLEAIGEKNSFSKVKKMLLIK